MYIQNRISSDEIFEKGLVEKLKKCSNLFIDFIQIENIQVGIMC